VGTALALTELLLAAGCRVAMVFDPGNGRQISIGFLSLRTSVPNIVKLTILSPHGNKKFSLSGICVNKFTSP
jgi:hypothetical protein